jgi:flagellar protein FliL
MADEEILENKAETVKPAGGGGAQKKNPLLTLVLLLNTVLMGAVAYMQFVAHEAEKKRPEVKDIITQYQEQQSEVEKSQSGTAVEEDGILFPLEAFTANLAQGDGPRRYVRLNTVLKFSKESNEEEFKSRKPQIRDAIISTLNSKRPEDLLKVEGKRYLKEEIKSAINTFLVDGKVIDIFYVGFQIN